MLRCPESKHRDVEPTLLSGYSANRQLGRCDAALTGQATDSSPNPTRDRVGRLIGMSATDLDAFASLLGGLETPTHWVLDIGSEDTTHQKPWRIGSG